MSISKTSLSSVWDAVDGILVINMDTNPARMEAFQKNVAVHLPVDKIHRLSAVVGRELPSYGKAPWFTDNTGERAKFWGGTGGCALSHRNAIAYAKSQGWRNVLIFEDDVVIQHPERLGYVINRTLRYVHGRYLFYLGYNKPAPHGRCKVDFGDTQLWKTEGVNATHSYIVPKSMYDFILGMMPENDDDIWAWLAKYRAIDSFYRLFLPMMGVSIYVTEPQFFVQSAQDSDIALEFFNVSVHSELVAPLVYKSALMPFRRILKNVRYIKNRLNSVRTRIRARYQGLPGYKKRNK